MFNVHTDKNLAIGVNGTLTHATNLMVLFVFLRANTQKGIGAIVYIPQICVAIPVCSEHMFRNLPGGTFAYMSPSYMKAHIL